MKENQVNQDVNCRYIAQEILQKYNRLLQIQDGCRSTFKEAHQDLRRSKHVLAVI
jgi:hypothetical protein